MLRKHVSSRGFVTREGVIIDNDLIAITQLVRFYQQPVLSSPLFRKLRNDRPLITTINRDIFYTVISQSSFSVNIMNE